LWSNTSKKRNSGGRNRNGLRKKKFRKKKQSSINEKKCKKNAVRALGIRELVKKGLAIAGGGNTTKSRGPQGKGKRKCLEGSLQTHI